MRKLHLIPTILCTLAAALCLPAGCEQPMGPLELEAFEKAGPILPSASAETVQAARLATGRYQIVADDVLEIHMPLVVRQMDPAGHPDPVLCRVAPDGKITLPIAGPVTAAGKTLSDVEAAVAAAYHPKYVKDAPPVVARVLEYRTTKVSVAGAVKSPGVYGLHSDEMTLVNALTKAGGIVPEGAAAIRIRKGAADAAQSLALPIKGLSIPFADVELTGGETIEVERLDTQVVTVVGLVNRPGVFTCSPAQPLTLAQALALAGGLNLLADPQYVKVCRQGAGGQLLTLPFQVGGSSLVAASRMVLKPGDTVAVENTPATDARIILTQVLGIGVGVSYSIR